MECVLGSLGAFFILGVSYFCLIAAFESFLCLIALWTTRDIT